MPWSYKQHFSLRAGTMLLIFVALLALIGHTDFLYDLVQTVAGGNDLFWRLGMNAANYVRFAAFFSLLFLGHSIIKKNPQVQFALELAAAVVFLIFLG